jgi:DNA-binding beta-propeller fold protein YncE
MSLPLVRAPQLSSDSSRWLNTGGQAFPLRRGIVYLLDFFTHGCINCQHVLPDLAYLEEKYRDAPFAVIGVHSGKFHNEQDLASIKDAVLRYGITHPVVQDDADYHLWRSYAVRAWPTFVLVDTRGYITATVSGEGNRQYLDEAIAELLTTAGQDISSPLPPPEPRPATPLSFPGKVLADSAGKRLFIADTESHRIVVAPLNGSAYHYLGNGQPGWMDGSSAQASFRSPQGMALSSDRTKLYIADAGNHVLRCVDLPTGNVETIAGNGRQQIGALQPGNARDISLNSPWDIALSPDNVTLYIAMAGSHQIAILNLSLSMIAILAGSGREGRQDGPALEAVFAQPSGIVQDKDILYVADAETSCIRQLSLIPLTSEPTVTTLAGGDLFDFGDIDAVGDAARFQHPLGIACGPDGTLYVADTYNHKVRQIIPTSGEVITIVGDGLRGILNEPGGLSVADGHLYIADTNHHRLCKVELATGELTDFPLPGLCGPEQCFP